eukprot:CAMPEP_0197189136 /NCGR_PEP_ID=MMETSP1423-20130617/19219_1 /TAXON_ID=476441 /ORGANISM="Pseudo-nitzschia heimii, Strain UNC1101" /LENGTH=689 /DNA_ID=CAMNT_0042641173 /DNA_START=93 /DNA_END=2162 /DNA_ORIENTATION=-
MKAEHERTRIQNYGKEASDILKAGSTPTKKSRKSATPEGDMQGPTETTDTEAAAAQQSKDITDMIQITNDFAFVDNLIVDTTSEQGGENPMDCFFQPPSFCPVDSDSDSLDGATRTVREAIDEHVVPKLDGASKSIRSTFDDHVVPGVEKIRQQSIETYGNLHKKSVDTIDAAKHHSIRGIDSAKEQSQRIFDEVKKNSELGVETVRRHTEVLRDRSKAAVDGVSAKTSEIINEKVKPGYQNFVETSQSTVRSKTVDCQIAFWGVVEAVTVTYAPYYSGTAPGWTSLTANSAIPWYWMLKEASLRAFGRVVFCDNPVTGFLIWLGILCSSPLAAWCSLLGVVTANATALYLELDEGITQSGQYARNAVLIGTSIAKTFAFDFPAEGNLDSDTPILLFLSIALAPMTLLVEFIWIKKAPSGIPSLLVPFNIVFLITVFSAKIWNFAMETQVTLRSPTPPEIDPDESSDFFSMYKAVLNGLTRVFFVSGNVFTGILILIGVFFCSRIIASSLLAGSFISSVLLGYIVFEENYWYLDSGYAGFNPALCTAGIFFYLVPSWKLTGLTVFGIVATMIAQGAVDVVLGILGTPVSTSLGFCLTLLPLLSMDFGTILGNRESYFIRNIPESELSTPEDYLKSIDSSLPDLDIDSDSSKDEETGTGSAVVAIENDETQDPEEGPEKPVVNEKTPLLT